jgi:hypothetical protein
MLEGSTPSYDSLLEKQTQAELEAGLKTPQVFYLGLFLGKIDHEGHATSEPAALLKGLHELDALAGQRWTAIQNSPFADQTLLVLVSDHGMNNVPGIVSQTYSLADLLNSPAGGAHHVVTNREQLSDFKFKSLYPLLQRVINASESSFYLRGQSDRYPTAWLDIDGNERASLHLRNSDLNKIHVLLQQLARPELPANLRKAAAKALGAAIDAHRAQWSNTATELDEELEDLKRTIETRKIAMKQLSGKFTKQQIDKGEQRTAWRLRQELEDWEGEYDAYRSYSARLKKLLVLEPDPVNLFRAKISDFLAEMSLGDSNTQQQLRHYVAGPTPAGLQMKSDGTLDDEASFRYVDYPKLFSEQSALNRPQA